MKNRLLKFGLSFIIIASLISALDFFVFQKSFYKKQYSKLNVHETIKISEKDLMKSTEVLLDYIKDDLDSIDVFVEIEDQSVLMFNQREIDHMKDVKVLYQNMKYLRNGLFILGLFIMLITFKSQSMFLYSIHLKHALLGVLSIIFGLSMFAVLDFTTFWTYFHLLLFSNDLWLLDPRTDRMILMFPEPFFNAMVLRLSLIFVVVLIFYSFLVIVLRKQSEREGK